MGCSALSSNTTDELIRQVAHHNFTPDALKEVLRVFPARPSRSLGTGRAILDRAVVHIPDVELDPEWESQGLSRSIGFRSGLFVPMLRGGDAVGAIMVARAAPKPFSVDEINLLRIFADQAVIAIESVRSHEADRVHSRMLAEALEYQTATAEVLGAMAHSRFELQAVVDMIVRAATRLCEAEDGAFNIIEPGGFRLLPTTVGVIGEVSQGLVGKFVPLDRGSLTGRVALDRRVVHIHDVQTDR